MRSYTTALRRIVALVWLVLILAWAVVAHVHDVRRRRRARRRYLARYA